MLVSNASIVAIHSAGRNTRGTCMVVRGKSAFSQETSALLKHPEWKLCVKLFSHSLRKPTGSWKQKAPIDTYVGLLSRGRLHNTRICWLPGYVTSPEFCPMVCFYT